MADAVDGLADEVEVYDVFYILSLVPVHADWSSWKRENTLVNNLIITYYNVHLIVFTLEKKTFVLLPQKGFYR